VRAVHAHPHERSVDADRRGQRYWTDPAGNGPLERSMDFYAEWLGARY
jgi:hypothetical protein